ncbi:hypothetical protein NPS34_25805 [Pseudomonas putida]|uniref:Uncharacterized protein n=1 Tax=Pseudomonas putida (strain ATCC 700007 / DSM 6899 / JCM 31910 / BCRC 17059 / LMG 24140 / F1) TaxID=351746 RepID=A5W5V8_PSEP1|nr:hypothetical protein [Pseudomonas putida]MDD2001450.1 hypothetical protein [Pseudomonas putida]HDS1791447.1 hypothetical protein [Pseudomonas putida]
MDPRYQEAKRQWDEFVQTETAAWPSDNPVIIVEYTVFGLGWEENGITGVRGKAVLEHLQEIETQLKTDEEIGEERHFTKGEGDYLLAVTYDDGEKDDYGRYIHSPYWDMSVIGFRTFDEVMARRVAGKEQN